MGVERPSGNANNAKKPVNLGSYHDNNQGRLTEPASDLSCSSPSWSCFNLFDICQSCQSHEKDSNEITIEKKNLLHEKFKTAEGISEEQLRNLDFRFLCETNYKDKRKKGGDFSKHPVKVSFNNQKDEYDAYIVKMTNFGGRKRRCRACDNGVLGVGAKQFVQEALLTYISNSGDAVYLKVALKAQEIPENSKEKLAKKTKYIQKMKELMSNYPELRKVCAEEKHLPFFSTQNHTSTCGEKDSGKCKKILSIAALSKDAHTKVRSGLTNDEKEAFKNGVVELLRVLCKNNLAHGDIKPENLDITGKSIDTDFFTSDDMNGVCYTGLYMGFHNPKFLSTKTRKFEDIQRVDAFSSAATIYFIYTKNLLVNDLDHLEKDEYGVAGWKKSDTVIHKIRERINGLPVDQETKQLLLDMTGTNETGPYTNGNNLYGEKLLPDLQKVMGEALTHNETEIIEDGTASQGSSVSDLTLAKKGLKNEDPKHGKPETETASQTSAHSKSDQGAGNKPKISESNSNTKQPPRCFSIGNLLMKLLMRLSNR